ncbi:hypothetical protein [Endozoicomonas sp. GU-1]|uniref:hypothetical protein n=1 Tax=Endozoicomonas sp. GU-1 TaxID=3009078 RepID=UPI0022B364FC|nr:hypothetical protein [Endozoicomonas sp. GU-1]WBA82316.1 hypothetical protein O2T12_03935 [Endozoicomonas sp. GU-1]WBA85253.1 hypothetical protein O3276_18625 [Endozoicomonas sp. GU-1]
MATPLSPSVTQQIYTPPAAGGLQTGQPSGPTGNYGGHNVGTHNPAPQLQGSGTGAPAQPYQQPPFSSVAQHPATSYMTPQPPAGAPTAAETAPATPEEAKTNGEQKAAEGEKKAAEGEKKAAEGEQKSAGGKTLLERLNLGNFLNNTRNAGGAPESKTSEQDVEKGKTAEKEKTADSEKSAEQKAPEKAPDQGAKQSAAPPAPAPAPAAHQPVSSQSPHTGHQQDPHRSAMPPYTPAPTHTPATPGNVQTPAYGAHPQVPGSTQHTQFDSRSVPPDSKESAPTPQRSVLEQRVDSDIQHMRSLVGEVASHYGQQGPTRDQLDDDALRDLSYHREQAAMHSKEANKCEAYLKSSSKPEIQKQLTEELPSQQTNEVRTSEQSRTQQTGQQSGLPPSLQDALGQEVFKMAKQGAIEGAREALRAQARGLENQYGPLGQPGTDV